MNDDATLYVSHFDKWGAARGIGAWIHDSYGDAFGIE